MKRVVLAGGSGNLGARITKALRGRDATVDVLTPRGTDARKLDPLRAVGAGIVEVDFHRPSELDAACAGASCVVSALAGLGQVVVETQSKLLDAAVRVGVKRFIPSDFSIDFTQLTPGQNRNLDLRRQFHERLDQADIKATSVFNGAFADLLTGQAPFILFKWRRVLVWGDADQRMDFTTVEDTAAFTAAVALDDATPRKLHIAGDRISARGLAQVMTELTGQRHSLFRPGGLRRFQAMISLAKWLTPASDALYPAWQGMQYMRDMFSGRALPPSLDNGRYPGLQWTSARQVLGS